MKQLNCLYTRKSSEKIDSTESWKKSRQNNAISFYYIRHHIDMYEAFDIVYIFIFFIKYVIPSNSRIVSLVS